MARSDREYAMQVLTLVVIVLAAISVLHLFLTFGLIARER